MKKEFIWNGPDLFYVGDSGKEGNRMMKGQKYSCEKYIGFMKDWRKNNWVMEI
jgi:hypothetical protein